ncbi:hypothetical protein KIN20_020793 [Parelaphostrongylus tenuis]|uniref:Uncharacterized protein n=1 Tax=Parelaphostrongylus tenuis TaxID=148309 RepID=A0AAD5N745_PARTN|nr:hypothetical protein KIN20_020793 [Parelaphostrongylus tenuis]
MQHRLDCDTPEIAVMGSIQEIKAPDSGCGSVGKVSLIDLASVHPQRKSITRVYRTALGYSTLKRK